MMFWLEEREEMYFYDLVFDGNKIVFPEYMVSQVVVLNDNFTIDTTIFNESYYDHLIFGVYSIADAYVFTMYKSRVVKKYIKESHFFVDVEVKGLPKESEVQFKHNDIFVQKNNIIVITTNNEILISDLAFSEVKYVKCIYKGMPHRQIAEDDEYIYIPIEKKIFRMSKNDFETNVYAQFDQIIDVFFVNAKGFWILTNDLQLRNLNNMGESVDISAYIHFYGNRKCGQIYNYESVYCYDKKVILVPGYCDNLLIFDTKSNQISEIIIEKEIENEQTLSRRYRKNIQKYIASCRNGQYILFLSSSSEILYIFDFETSLITKCLRGINSRFVIEKDLEHKKILGEQVGGIDLKSYIKYITNK